MHGNKCFLLTIESVVLLKNKQTRKGTLTLYFLLIFFGGRGAECPTGKLFIMLDQL